MSYNYSFYTLTFKEILFVFNSIPISKVIGFYVKMNVFIMFFIVSGPDSDELIIIFALDEGLSYITIVNDWFCDNLIF